MLGGCHCLVAGNLFFTDKDAALSFGGASFQGKDHMSEVLRAAGQVLRWLPPGESDFKDLSAHHPIQPEPGSDKCHRASIG